MFVSEKSLVCLASARRQIKIKTIHDFGLLCHPTKKLAAFSPDAIAGALVEDLPSGPTRYVALVEMKSKCSLATLTQENKLIAEFGEYQEINADEEDPELFK